MTIAKYDEPMHDGVRIRLTTAQSNSLHAIAHAMSLTIGDVVRASVDDWICDIPEARLFTARIVWLKPARKR